MHVLNILRSHNIFRLQRRQDYVSVPETTCTSSRAQEAQVSKPIETVVVVVCVAVEDSTTIRVGGTTSSLEAQGDSVPCGGLPTPSQRHPHHLLLHLLLLFHHNQRQIRQLTWYLQSGQGKHGSLWQLNRSRRTSGAMDIRTDTVMMALEWNWCRV